MTNVSLCSKCHYVSPMFRFLIPDKKTSMNRTYTTPTAVEINRIASTIPTIGDNISFLDKEITCFQATLAFMKLLRRRLKRDATQWNTYIPPSGMHRLPVEVLDIIFELSCNSSEPDAFKMPLSLSWTCFKWRQIVLFRPQLWTHIYASPSVSQSLVDLYVKRSGTDPLLVKIENVSSSPSRRIHSFGSSPNLGCIRSQQPMAGGGHPDAQQSLRCIADDLRRR